MHTHDVVVVGAGLAGLRCAHELARHGRDVVVLESDDRVGGRQRTDRVDGFLLDRGFQVLNPAYPAVRSVVDISALGLRSFPVGVRVRRETGTSTLAHPLRHPELIPATLSSGLLSRADLLGIARWMAPALAPRRMVASPDRTLAEGWDAAGLRGALRTDVLEPFLAGVLADDSGTTSDTYARLLTRLFAIGRPGLPARGIAALGQQLADTARAEGADIRLGHTVRKLRRRDGYWRVATRGAPTIRARDVVVAVGPDVVSRLIDIPPPRTRGLQTWWFAAAEPPPSALLTLDGTRGGPIVNSVVMSHTAPSYAPPGRHLVQATCLLAAESPPSEPDVRRQLVGLWGAAAASWEVLRRDDVPHALPALPPPMRRRSPTRLGDGLHVAGDHRDTPSIQGALGSGLRAARGVVGSRAT